MICIPDKSNHIFSKLSRILFRFLTLLLWPAFWGWPSQHTDYRIQQLFLRNLSHYLILMKSAVHILVTSAFDFTQNRDFGLNQINFLQSWVYCLTGLVSLINVHLYWLPRLTGLQIPLGVKLDRLLSTSLSSLPLPPKVHTCVLGITSRRDRGPARCVRCIRCLHCVHCVHCVCCVRC